MARFSNHAAVVVVLAAGAFTTPDWLHAADHGCKVTSRSDAIVVLVCPQGLDMKAWRDASVEACKGRQNCNVWIWDDPAKAPTNSPAKDSDIPRASVDASKGVWVNGTQTLLQARKIAP
jgi:hypothetical protein